MPLVLPIVLASVFILQYLFVFTENSTPLTVFGTGKPLRQFIYSQVRLILCLHMYVCPCNYVHTYLDLCAHVFVCTGSRKIVCLGSETL